MNREYWEKEEPIEEIKCTNTDCENGLHSFRNVRPKKGQTYRVDTCISCDIDIIDWERLSTLDIKDVQFTVDSLNNEWIRNYYWYRPIAEKAEKWTRKRNLSEIHKWSVKNLKTKLNPHPDDIWQDGSQTPYHGNLVEYAKHATATCCRKCLQEWYSIERKKELSNEETEYAVDLIMHYIKTRKPEISDNNK